MKQARLVERGHNINGGTYEIWRIGDGRGIYVDFIPDLADRWMPETMAYNFDLRKNSVTSWLGLRVWYEDATGGMAIRELGYEPVEEGSDDTD